jgi:hypothetical protein
MLSRQLAPSGVVKVRPLNSQRWVVDLGQRTVGAVDEGLCRRARVAAGEHERRGHAGAAGAVVVDQPAAGRAVAGAERERVGADQGPATAAVAVRADRHDLGVPGLGVGRVEGAGAGGRIARVEAERHVVVPVAGRAVEHAGVGAGADRGQVELHHPGQADVQAGVRGVDRADGLHVGARPEQRVRDDRGEHRAQAQADHDDQHREGHRALVPAWQSHGPTTQLAGGVLVQVVLSAVNCMARDRLVSSRLPPSVMARLRPSA